MEEGEQQLCEEQVSTVTKTILARMWPRQCFVTKTAHSKTKIKTVQYSTISNLYSAAMQLVQEL